MPIKKESEKVNLDSITDDYILPNNAILESKINVKNSKQRFSGKVILAVAFGLMAIIGLLMLVKINDDAFRTNAALEFRLDWLNASIFEQADFVSDSGASNLVGVIFTVDEEAATHLVKEYGQNYGLDNISIPTGDYSYNPVTGEVYNLDNGDPNSVHLDGAEVFTAYQTAFIKSNAYAVYAQDIAFDTFTFRGWTRLLIGLVFAAMFIIFLTTKTRRTTERTMTIIVLILSIISLCYSIYKYSFENTFIENDKLRDSIITVALVITGSMLVLEGISSEVEDINNKILRKPSGNE